MDTTLLRQQQITLGLLKAARVLCSRQDNLRQILNHQAESSDGGSSTFSLQQLMCSAIKPSPIKALFDREELEVHFSLEHLQSTLSLLEDPSVKRTPRVDPFLSFLPLFFSSLSAVPKGVRKRDSWLYPLNTKDRLFE